MLTSLPKSMTLSYQIWLEWTYMTTTNVLAYYINEWIKRVNEIIFFLSSNAYKFLSVGWNKLDCWNKTNIHPCQIYASTVTSLLNSISDSTRMEMYENLNALAYYITNETKQKCIFILSFKGCLQIFKGGINL